LSLHAVERSSGREFKASVLGAYERGERIISVLRLQRLAQVYGVPVDQILPRNLASESPLSDAKLRFSPRRPVRIDLERLGQLGSPEAGVVRGYVETIQRQRGEFHRRSISIRDDDLTALGRFFHSDDVAMEMKLVELGLHG
jgi:transcriptional regulator with XRE-family HTH domain